MRVIIKGGVWKNTEDEILKGAVMKYGKNQWARISSLLVRKTPSQCKARWYEWIDPSIRKTEWSREEDEKLLHLAKLMPTQWRTIAPIVGRTAAQCLERYQKLLDDAEKEGEGLGLTGDAGGEHGPSADDVRRLRPGEMDPDPETKPARPDPVDMDEDEKEMLSEARARLANTQGKKAKRKAREKQLQEARRLAILQKRRELKASGIRMKLRVPKGQMDYNSEIPFEKKPAIGFYDTTSESAAELHLTRSRPFQRASLQDLEGGKRRHELEDQARKRDAKRLKEKKEAQGGILFSPEQAAREQKEREEERIGKRRKLNLPAPQVGDAELESLVKMGLSSEAARNLLLSQADGASRVTDDLLGDYTDMSTISSSARTPRTPAGHDQLLSEARQQRASIEQQTPLLGGMSDTPSMEHSGTGFNGATPSLQPIATPNPLLTPLRGPSAGASSDPRFTPRPAPSSSSATSATPNTLELATPIRDIMGINEDLEMERQLAEAKRRLGHDLLSLPAPKNDYDIVLPEAEVVEVADEDAYQGHPSGYLREEDAEAAEKRRTEVRRAAEEARLKRRTQALQRSLPRPPLLNPALLLGEISALSSSDRGQAEELILREMTLLMVSDAVEEPVPGGKVLESDGLALEAGLERFSDADLASARALLRVESDREISKVTPEQAERLDQLILSELPSYTYVPRPTEGGKKALFSVDARSMTDSVDRINTARAEWMRLRREMERGTTAAERLEAKLEIALRDAQTKAKDLRVGMDVASLETERSTDDHAAYLALAREETQGAPRRVASLRAEVDLLVEVEARAQERYAHLSRERAAVYARCTALSARVHPPTQEASS